MRSGQMGGIENSRDFLCINQTFFGEKTGGQFNGFQSITQVAVTRVSDQFKRLASKISFFEQLKFFVQPFLKYSKFVPS